MTSKDKYYEEPRYAKLWDVPPACYIVGTLGVLGIIGSQAFGFLYLILLHVGALPASFY